ncbi:MAG: 5-dehydro-2-deoxygluconokinase, partial [Caulobacteraceae bacterium]
MASFAKSVGGSPTNLAIGASRLGLKAGLVTAVGADAMGRFILETLEREAVEHRFVKVDPERLTALVLLGVRGEGRFELLFHRENAPDLTISEADIDPAYVARAGAVALSGTHLSTPTVRAASLKAARLARAAGAKVILDIDFRPALWGLAPRQSGEARLVLDGEASRILLEAASLCDLVVGDEDEVRSAAGMADLATALRRLREATEAIIVVKRGARGAIAFEGAIPEPPQPLDAPPAIVSPGFPVEVCNLVGAGDAFLAALLSSWLKGSDLLAALARGNAAGALVAARLGCAPAMASRAELDAFLERRPRQPDADPEIARLHRAAERERGKPGSAGGELFILAIDHRFQIEDLARSFSADPGRLAVFKSLALRALHEAAAGDARYGILLDGEHGASALAAAADLPYWTGRPIERPLVRPLEFDGGADVGIELRRWPARLAVKCLVRLHPEDSGTLVAEEIAELRRLFHACRETGRELMIEIVTPEGRAREARSDPWAIRTLYSA